MILQGPSGSHTVSQVSFLLELGHIEMHRVSICEKRELDIWKIMILFYFF